MPKAAILALGPISVIKTWRVTTVLSPSAGQDEVVRVVDGRGRLLALGPRPSVIRQSSELVDAGEGALHRPAGALVFAHLLAGLGDDVDAAADAQVDLARRHGGLVWPPPGAEAIGFGPCPPHGVYRCRVGALEVQLLPLLEQLCDHG